MSFIFRLAGGIISATVVVVGDFFLHEFLPFPFSQFNLIFTTFAWVLIVVGSHFLPWIFIPSLLVLELFSPVSFGIHSVAFFLSLLLVSWLLAAVFVTRSLPIIGAVCLLGIFCFRLVFFAFTVVAAGFNYSFLSWSLVVSWLWEMSLTSLVFTAAYFISSLFNKRLRPEYVQ